MRALLVIFGKSFLDSLHCTNDKRCFADTNENRTRAIVEKQ